MLRLFLLLLTALALSQCTSMRADGGLKKLTEGQLFEGEELKTRPPDNTAMRQLDDPDVSLKMEF
jgi:hypothetical protein